MVGDWFAADCDLPSKPEVHRIATAAGLDADVVIGRLWRWFSWVDRQAKPHPTKKGDGLLVGMTAVDVARELGGDSAFWVCVSKSAPEWLRFDERGACVPGYDKRFSKSAKRRLEDAQRKRESRAADRGDAAEATAGTDPTQPAESPKKRKAKGWAYSLISAEILASPIKVVEWCVAAAGDRTTGVEDNESWHIALIAAARTSLKAENPAAYFITLVRDKGLTTIPESAITKARAEYSGTKRLLEQMRNAWKGAVSPRTESHLTSVIPMQRRG
jgi:hypothetical protein